MTQLSFTALVAQGNVMMRLGDFKFMILTAAYQEFRRKCEFKWGTQQRFQRGPSSQFVGIGDDTITLTGTIYTEFRGGTGQLERLRKMGAAGFTYLLIGGVGDIYGQWYIESIDETNTLFAAFGTERKQEFNITLKKDNG